MNDKRIVYIDMDDTLCQLSSELQAVRSKGIEFPHAIHNFWLNLPPVDQAIESVRQLRSNPRFELYVLSAPSVRNRESNWKGGRNASEMPPWPCKPLKMWCERGFDSYGSVNFKFIAIDKTLLNLCQTLAFMHGLQSMAGNLLAALMSDKDELYYGKFAKHLMAFFNIFVNQ